MSPPNLYGGRRSPNKQALDMLATVAAGNIEPSAPRPVIRFVKTKHVLHTATQSFIAYGAVQGIQRFFPAAWADPRFTIQLVFGLPQTFRAVRQGRMNLAMATPVMTIGWFVTFTALSGIVQSVLISTNSTYFAQATRVIGNAFDKSIRGAANSSTIRYKIAQIIGHFVYAYMQYKGTAPTLQGANSFSRAFAADMTGTLGSGLALALRKAGRAAVRYPVESAVIGTMGAMALVKKKNTSRGRSRRLKAA